MRNDTAGVTGGTALGCTKSKPNSVSCRNGSHRRTETGQRGDVAGQALELPVVTPTSAAATNCSMCDGSKNEI